MATASRTLCEPRTFTQISFANASLVRSDLGGAGGRCDLEPSMCTGAPDPAARDVYIAGVGTERGERIDLRITNESECVTSHAMPRP